MKLVEKFFKKGSVYFEKGAKLHKLYYLWEAADTFFMTPGKATTGSVHVRDGLDLKRMMTFVMISLLPCILFGLYNVGYQSNVVLSGNGLHLIPGFRGELLNYFNITADPQNILFCFLHGATYFIPIFVVTLVVGIFWEVLFSSVRKEEVNEGFFVTAPLYALILPPTIPLWQVALGISFGVVIAKEVFGGTGMNFLNPALAARAFLFFAYPAEISGDLVWIAVDGHTGATALSQFAASGNSVYSFMDAFIGKIPGAIGETSAIACILGGIFLIVTKVGSYRIILSCIFGAMATSFMFNFIGSTTNHMFNIPAYYHLVYGGFMFGCVFMATDPVSGAQTLLGQYFYGLLIGVMVILVRVVNPAYPEGMMLSILFANVFAPLIDYFVIAANIKRRRNRCQTTA